MKNSFVFIIGLIFSANILAASTNYGARYDNDDGSVTIAYPKFSVDGVNYPLNYELSDIDGVCKLYGLGKYVEDSLLRGNIESGAVIDRNGNFKRLYKHITIASLICESGSPAPAKASERYGKLFRNDDGSVTIVNPAFGSPTSDGDVLPIYYGSDITGVCKLFGFKSAVEDSDTQSNIVWSVNINEHGRFQGFRKHITIGRLLCRP